MSERAWLCVALAGFLLMFERWSILEVKQNEVVVSRISFWVREKEIKKMSVTDVGGTGIVRRWGGKHRHDWLVVRTRRGGVFFDRRYYGTIFTAPFESPKRDLKRFRAALRSDTGFRSHHCESLTWFALIFIAGVGYWYERSWRLERERQARNKSQPGPKNVMKVPAVRKFRIKPRLSGGKVRLVVNEYPKRIVWKR